MIAVFTAFGTIATSVICFLTWKGLQVSRQQFAAMNADHIIARLAWDDNLVLLILENTGAMPADRVSIEFPQWFNEELDKLNDEISGSDYVKSMTHTLRTNKRPIQGHSNITFLLCKNKTRFYEVMRPHGIVRVSITWRDLRNKKRKNEHDIDLIDEIILEWDPFSKIAKQVKKIAENGAK